MHDRIPGSAGSKILPVKFRAGGKLDSLVCAQIWMRATAVRDGTACELRVLQRALTKLAVPGAVLSVAERGSEIRGFALASDETVQGGARRAHVSLLGVDPMSQGIGLGRSLIQMIGDVLARDGFEEATLNVLQDNAAARRIYARAGWQESGRGEFSDSGRPFVAYVLSLGARKLNLGEQA